VVIHDALHAWYRRCGYTLVEVPRMDVAGRCNFMLKTVR